MTITYPFRSNARVTNFFEFILDKVLPVMLKLRPFTLLLLAALSSPSMAGQPVPICDEFRRLLDTPLPNGIGTYQLEASIPVGGKESDERYFNLDIDGDDANDFVTVSCSASSSMPADPCILLANLSSGKKIKFEKDRFYLVRLHSKIYAIANHGGAGVNIGKRQVYLFDRHGINLLCSKL